ncbi:MAG: hypothetical protein ABIP89_11705 [Polyangiaceae bacterium]
MSTNDEKKTENARRLFAAGAILAAVGLALCGTVSKPIGGVAVLAGWAALTAAIHTYGRLGEG